ncbi:hypothetical protein AG1IA_00622 [Rhizoctonia solani AG-1 IA]|uniref:Uncharacterized protein n=1 Tax=Thanatephorus cucumeris (strain AG1-IA) TaxID=983506 RepID=L8X9J0_THACA|nr:hypothetical protein AG1IA_00622 [Rhizoctonia solani AG-1 IA]
MDNNFVSKGRIQQVSPNGSFKIPSGIDSALHVSYSTAKTLNRKISQSGFPFMAKEKQSVSVQSQTIIIRHDLRHGGTAVWTGIKGGNIRGRILRRVSGCDGRLWKSTTGGQVEVELELQYATFWRRRNRAFAESLSAG